MNLLCPCKPTGRIKMPHHYFVKPGKGERSGVAKELEEFRGAYANLKVCYFFVCDRLYCAPELC
jgi:hypothetical protein